MSNQTVVPLLNVIEKLFGIKPNQNNNNNKIIR